MAARARSFITQLSALQDRIGRVAGAISRTAPHAIHVWSGRGFCKRATAVVAVNDRLFPPPILSFVIAEYCCECLARDTCWCCNACSADFTGQRNDSSAAIQTR